MIDPNMVMYLW